MTELPALLRAALAIGCFGFALIALGFILLCLPRLEHEEWPEWVVKSGVIGILVAALCALGFVLKLLIS